MNAPELCDNAGAYADCDGNCNGDYEGDGVDECDEVSGCASASAVNFNPFATNDDGSCIWGDGSFQGLTYEVVGDSTVGENTTYRVYAQFDPNADIDMTSLFGNANTLGGPPQQVPSISTRLGRTLGETSTLDLFTSLNWNTIRG